MKTKIWILSFLLLIIGAKLSASVHPGLMLTPKGVKEIRSSMSKYPLFIKSLNEQRSIADKALAAEMVVPVPKDGGGGYTHEKHKDNYYEMYAAGTLYQITGYTRYARFVRDMLLKYADLYPTLGLHPAVKSATPGKLFWQALNDAVWLVHVANAYDCVYDFMSEKDRSYVEKNLFYPMVEFISNGNPNNYAVFNKMHNHGTWALTAVGMIGYAMGDQELVNKALYGSKKDGKSGFFRQMDVLFSPDGYFTEGPYYQRYAIWPFMTFAQIIQNKQPELAVFNYRDSILLKAVHTMLHCTYDGEIFYLNDALLKTIQTQEIVSAVDIAYKNNPSDKQLLDVARQQGTFTVSDAGFAAAKALAKKEARPFDFKSILLHDGQKGDEGGIAIFRSGETCMTLKATSHGLSHGHYDKLSLVLYDHGNLVLPDYGAVRFLNIEPKNGGHYTPENYTWGMQTIAHNTVTIDQKSHFNAQIETSSAYHSDIQYCDFTNPALQLVCASENNAYKGVRMQRISALITNNDFEYPFVIDFFDVKSDSIHTLDLPFYYRGQMVSTNFDYQKNTNELKALGSENGYQHLWLEAMGKTDKPNACFTWVNNDRFYSITTLSDSSTSFLMTRVGAGDPHFNLRPEPCFMIRQNDVKNHRFVSIIEPHGLYDLSKEVTSGFQSAVSSLELIPADQAYTVLKMKATTGKEYLLIRCNDDFDVSKSHSLRILGKEVTFKGHAMFTDFNK
ncbi:MAG TPA: alginate lyase family protein [Bacteroidales bacterium]|nr:alginate lyase family protein [Bacteroidales bacterium]